MVIQKMVRIGTSIRNYILLHKKGVNYDKSIKINGPIFIVGTGRNILIGKNVKFNSGKKMNPVGGENNVLLQGNISIGDNVGISNTTIVAMKEVKIGSNVLIGGGTKIYDSDFHSISYFERMKIPDSHVKSAKIEICDGAFIGGHCIILKGVTIGEKSIVGAGSVVTKSIPNGEIWAGNPAKFLKKVEK